MPDNGGDDHDVAFTVSRRALKRAGIIGAAVLVLAAVGIGAYFLGRSSTPVDSASRPQSRPAAVRSTSTTTTSAAPSTTSVPMTTAPSTTTTAAPSFTAFIGHWEAHDTTGVTIDTSGRGSVGFPDFVVCPDCSEVGAPTNALDFSLTSVEGTIATGTLTSSTDPNGIDSSGNTVDGVYTVGSPVTVTLGAGSPGQLLTLSVGGNEVGRFCDQTASSTQQCGA
jgi:hypothetical protein